MTDMSRYNERTEKALDTENTVRPVDKQRPGGAKKKKGKPDDESLLAMDTTEAAKAILKDWDDSRKHIKRFMEQWKVNRARSQGYVGVSLIKKQDQQQAYIPMGARKSPAGMNKAARLKRRIRANIFSDPPKPECTPSRDDDQARDEAQMSTRVLDDLCAEGNLAYTLNAGDAFDFGGDYGSGFIRFYVDPQGGGWRPKQIEASPVAQRPDDPFPMDPQTGQPAPVEPVLRYVTEDGQFTEERTEAARAWLPKLKEEVLTGKHVRLIPFDADDIWEADGAMVGSAVTLRELKALFEDVNTWSQERLEKLIAFRPQHFKDLLPHGSKDVAAGTVSDDSWVFVLTRYHKQSAKYPEGAYLCACGEDELLHRSKWFDEEHGEPLDIPITQFKQFSEEGNPYGDGVMTALGPGNELRAAMLGAELEHLDRFNNRRIFLPMTSTLQPQQLLTPTGTVLPMMPGTEPKYEEIPDFPLIVKEMLEFSSHDMDDESGLQSSGQGVNPPGVKSGLHANVVMQQVNAGLSDLRQNTERGLVRGWRLMLQQVRWLYTVPQQISWVGDDGRYKQQHWTNADLGSTKDVRIQRGTFTMLTPQGKAEIATQYHAAGLLNPAEFQHVTESAVGGVFGLQDNPHRLRVRRQISEWQEGPKQPPQMPGFPIAPPGMPPQANGLPPQPGMPPQGPPPPPPNPFAVELSKIFDERPVDRSPQVAVLREYELGRAMASTKYHDFPPGWQAGLNEAYSKALQASQIPNADQAKAMQDQMKTLQQENMDQKIKLNAASVSFSAKLADLDENQTLALLQQEHIQVPPRATPAPNGAKPPEPSPEQQIAVDLKKHQMSVEADIHKERIKQSAKTEQTAMQMQHAVQLAQVMGQSAKPGKHRVKKDADGSHIIEPIA